MSHLARPLFGSFRNSPKAQRSPRDRTAAPLPLFFVLRWYQARNYPVAAVRPDKPSESIEGLDLSIPSLPSTSVSIIIHPVKSLGILQSLFADPANAPHSVWFQPGADDDSIWKWVKEKGLGEKIVGHGACVLRDGDGVLDAIKSDGKAKI
ncbi:hypothetical protein B9479_000940 [Cryptococcus floricola]|uniref:CoA-binding domain-containing protein n=1 Tax=Cryptococcus floricola TaxID=2591691 RepID=A0A5D3B6G3_9TREE|nr:hypothetical protein B9479_000940 [Cryptococcus floricola]